MTQNSSEFITKHEKNTFGQIHLSLYARGTRIYILGSFMYKRYIFRIQMDVRVPKQIFLNIHVLFPENRTEMLKTALFCNFRGRPAIVLD